MRKTFILIIFLFVVIVSFACSENEQPDILTDLPIKEAPTIGQPSISQTLRANSNIINGSDSNNPLSSEAELVFEVKTIQEGLDQSYSEYPLDFSVYDDATVILPDNEYLQADTNRVQQLNSSIYNFASDYKLCLSSADELMAKDHPYFVMITFYEYRTEEPCIILVHKDPDEWNHGIATIMLELDVFLIHAKNHSIN